MQSGIPENKVLSSQTQITEDTLTFSLGCKEVHCFLSGRFCPTNSWAGLAFLSDLFNHSAPGPMFLPKLWAVPCLPHICGWTNCFLLLSAVVRLVWIGLVLQLIAVALAIFFLN